MSGALFVTGGSSGIGAAFLAAAPAEYEHVVSFSRRPAAGKWFPADLGDTTSWPVVVAANEAGLDESEADHAVLFHCAGTAAPMALLADADPATYAEAVVLDFASGPVVGQAFLRACRARGIRATLLVCSSPAADLVIPMQAHYCGSKAGLSRWAEVAAAESAGDTDTRIVTVVPYATLTDMVRSAMGEDPDVFPMAQLFRETAERDGFATAEETAGHVWAAVASATNGDVVEVGAVPTSA
jgi:NAD(P)-dependent dehydrogenase (short-subunit alcohol dehydrogenase family)